MMIYCLLVTMHIGSLGITVANSYSVDKCIQKGDSNLSKIEHCMVRENDVDIICPVDEIIVLSPLRFVTKNTRDICVKRVLTHKDLFCCIVQDTDTIYNADCLQDIWSSEDNQHYRQFMQEALMKCRHTSHCVLYSRMFRNLQKEVPKTGKYSSYLQVTYQCVKAPTKPVSICSTNYVTGNDIHIQKPSSISNTRSNDTCNCRVTSDSEFVVRAVDVGMEHSGLVLSSDYKAQHIANGQLPMFGFREVFTGQKLDISVTNRSTRHNDNLWLHISGSNGKKVNVVCAPKAPQQALFSSSGTKSDKASPSDKDEEKNSDFDGYWPIIYASAGAFGSFIPIAFIVIVFLVCRHRTKKPKRRGNNTYEKTFVEPRLTSQQPVSYPGYKTLVIDLPETALAVGGQVPMRRPVVNRARKSVRISLGPPMTLAPPPPTVQTSVTMSNNRASILLSMDHGGPGEVMELDPLMDCYVPPAVVQCEKTPSVVITEKGVNNSNPFQVQHVQQVQHVTDPRYDPSAPPPSYFVLEGIGPIT